MRVEDGSFIYYIDMLRFDYCLCVTRRLFIDITGSVAIWLGIGGDLGRTCRFSELSGRIGKLAPRGAATVGDQKAGMGRFTRIKKKELPRAAMGRRGERGSFVQVRYINNEGRRHGAAVGRRGGRLQCGCD